METPTLEKLWKASRSTDRHTPPHQKKIADAFQYTGLRDGLKAFGPSHIDFKVANILVQPQFTGQKY